MRSLGNCHKILQIDLLAFYWKNAKQDAWIQNLVQFLINPRCHWWNSYYNPFYEYYFYHRIGYDINSGKLQKKIFVSIFCMIIKSMNDLHILHKFRFYTKVQHHRFFHVNKISPHNKLTPYLFANKCYSRVSWVIAQYIKGDHSLFKSLYNRKHKQGIDGGKIVWIIKSTFHDI
jgi:hypothetical protein